jgi:formyltetrahydrofolate-dependent phosphoribosylglycinamide formyltransferase
MRSRIAVLVSGRGSNLQAILDYLDRSSGRASYEVAAVISNRADAPALDIARSRGIPAATVDSDPTGERLLAALDENRIDLVALAGYLKKIPETVIDAYARRIVNVHPALLPAHGGPGMYGSRVHESVLAAGEQETGVTVHLVDADYDSGPIVAQWVVPVHEGDDAHSLAARVLELEHALYPRALDLIATLHQRNNES